MPAELYDYCVAKGPLPEKLARVFMTHILTGPLPQTRIHINTFLCLTISRVPSPFARTPQNFGAYCTCPAS
jgi:hypothetical protein